jgi:large subunit ribosomal protein L22
LEARAIARYIGISPRKARMVIDNVRGLDVDRAIDVLDFTNRAAAKEIKKVVQAARANIISKNKDVKVDESRLYISRAYVDEGPTLKRFQPVSRGRAFKIRKRACHIAVYVSERKVG